MIADCASVKRWKLPFGAGSAIVTGAKARTRLSALRRSVKACTWPRSRRAGFARTLSGAGCQNALVPCTCLTVCLVPPAPADETVSASASTTTPKIAALM